MIFIWILTQFILNEPTVALLSMNKGRWVNFYIIAFIYCMNNGARAVFLQKLSRTDLFGTLFAIGYIEQIIKIRAIFVRTVFNTVTTVYKISYVKTLCKR